MPQGCVNLFCDTAGKKTSSRSHISGGAVSNYDVSTHYALYGDISSRVMTIIEQMAPATEVYSLDEAFAELTGLQGDLQQYAHLIKDRILRCTGIPVGIGIASSKTLAKLANHGAKKWDKTKAAIHGLELIYQPGFAFMKAEVLLLNICQSGEYTPDLFASEQPATSQRLMEVMDQINAKWGRGTMRPARIPASPEWAMNRDFLSPSYTTRLDQLWKVQCR